MYWRTHAVVCLIAFLLVACVTEKKQRKSAFTQDIEEETPTKTTEKPIETEKPKDEAATKDAIDLGLEGSGNGEVKIESGDTKNSSSADPIQIGTGCEADDIDCLKKYLLSVNKQAVKKCGTDKECLAREASAAAKKVSADEPTKKPEK